VSTLWVCATVLAVFVTIRRLFGDGAALCAAALYGLYQQWADWRTLAFNGEVLMNLPIAWAYAVAFGGRRRAGALPLLAAGALCGVAFLFKQPGGAAAAALAAYPLAASFRQRSGISRLASLWLAGAVGAGAVIPVLAVGGLLWQQGLLADAWYWTVGDHDVPVVLWQHGILNTLLFVAACAPFVGLAVWSWRRRDLWAGREPERTALAWLTVWSTIGAFASARFYPHYYIAIVLPLALLAGPALARLLSAPRQARERRAGRALGVLYGTTAAIFFALHTIGLAQVPEDTGVARAVRERTAPEDRIFVWGRGTRIYLDAQRRPASRYVSTFPLTGRIFGLPPSTIDTRDRILPGAWDNLARDFGAHPPACIVDLEVGEAAQYPVAEFPTLARLLAHDYELVAREAEGNVYRRRDETAVVN
jgi:4-amino-4-deoxy-L-arabinose transferase-like glycosyltransferase